MEKSLMSIIEKLTKPFPKDKIRERKGNWNKEKADYDVYSYVQSDDIVERLHEALGPLGFSITIPGFNGNINDLIGKNSGNKPEVVLMVELSFLNPETGARETVTGIGSKEVTTNLGNDFKSAKSKAISNAAKLWGVAADLELDGIPDETDGHASNSASASDDAVGTSGLRPKISIDSGIKVKTEAVATPEDSSPLISTARSVSAKEEERAPVKDSLVAKKVVIGGPRSPEIVNESDSEYESREDEPKHSTYSESEDHKCEKCGCTIVAAEDSKGRIHTPKDLAIVSKTTFGIVACAPCIATLKREKLKKKEQSAE